VIIINTYCSPSSSKQAELHCSYLLINKAIHFQPKMPAPGVVLSGALFQTKAIQAGLITVEKIKIRMNQSIHYFSSYRLAAVTFINKAGGS
jgi:hypothetical protein